MKDDDFYEECGKLLGVAHEGEGFAHYRRNRWNNRAAGRGRYPGRGMIRIFGEVVHVTLRDPVLTTSGTKEEILEILRQISKE